MSLRWDDLDRQGCADQGAPDWNSMIVVGPTRIRDRRGNVSLQWTVTVQCEPVAPATEAPAPAGPVLAAVPEPSPGREPVSGSPAGRPAPQSPTVGLAPQPLLGRAEVV